jgi:tRNA A-37 threonylcarbamoyl transferase component Bud32
VLPQRDLLLDAEFVAGRLAAQLGKNGPLSIERCEQLRVNYRVGKNLRVLHRVTIAGQHHFVASRTFPFAKHASAQERTTKCMNDCGALRAAFFDTSLGTLFSTFPNDAKITGLAKVVNAPRALSQVLGSAWISSRLVAYAPGKCATVQCLDDHGGVRAYAKVYAGGEGERCYGVYRALKQSIRETGAQLEIPEALEYSEKAGILILESIEGTRLDRVRESGQIDGMHKLGSALARLHSLPATGGFGRFTRLDPERLQNAALIIGLVRPDEAVLAAELADELCFFSPKLREAPVWLHGDVHPKNAVLRGNNLVLIDLDNAAPGPAAADLGSMCAALRYNRSVGMITERTERRLRSALLAGYARNRTLPPADCLRWHTAAALVAECALRAVNRVRAEGLQQLGTLLAHAMNIAGGKDGR